jgi:low temperature requirement protein LtrA
MARPRLWQPPLLRHDESQGRHRPVTWLELFLDLFVVVVLARITHELAAHGYNGAALATFLGQFLPLFWVWVGMAYYLERFETDGLEFRLKLLGFMAAIAAQGAFSHDGLGQHFTGFALAYGGGRAFTAGLWLLAARHNPPPVPAVARRLAATNLAGVTLVLAAIPCDGALRYSLFAAGLLLDVLGPRWFATLQSALPPVSTSKYPERFGLFTIIVLGEGATGLINGAAAVPQHTLASALAAASGLAVVFGLWWIYFDFVGRRRFRPTPGHILAWIYSHIGLYASIAIAGSALAGVLAKTTLAADNAAADSSRALALAVAGYLGFVALLEIQLKRSADEPTGVIASPLLKVGCGLAALGLALLPPAPALLPALLLGVLLPVIGYGLYVWHQPRSSEAAHGH